MAVIDLSNKSVLIVDDMERVRVKIADLYEQVGIKVVGMAENGVEALDKIQKLKPDIISLDIVMPVMDGIECYREIQRRNLELSAGRVNSEMWPSQVRTLILSCLAGEAKIISHYESEIPSFKFVEKYPTVESLKNILNVIFNHEATMLPVIKESA